MTLLIFMVALLYATSTVEAEMGFSLVLEPPDLYLGNLTATERIGYMVRLSEARAEYLLQASGVGLNQLPRQDVSYETLLMYKVRIGIGSPPVSQSLLLDTGSEITWAQCWPCNPCFDQDLPHYTPRYSTSYHPLPCNSTLCFPGTCVAPGFCQYTVWYGEQGGPISKGTFAHESFDLGGQVTLPDIIFGCSNQNTRRFFQTSRIAGILGMSPGRRSLVKQLGSRINYRFSYCLLPPNHHQGSSFLRFGSDARLLGRGKKITPLHILNSHVHHRVVLNYFLNLEDITINGARLNLPPDTFRRPDGSPGTMIDSGSPFTLLIDKAYIRVVRHLKAYFENQHHLHRVHGGHGLKLCYHKPNNGFEDYPSITFHFQDADLHLGKHQSFLIMDTHFCLAMKMHNHGSIFGAAQQTNFRFVYDVSALTLTFAPRDCAADN